MESVFAVVDIFFVGRIGKDAVATVALTESVLTLVYSVAIGLSMAATAMVARRIGEKKPEEASKSAVQAIMIALVATAVVSISGFLLAPNILQVMGASKEVVDSGSSYTRVIFGGSIVIMMLYLINGIFRGAGNASMAMWSLWIANGFNDYPLPDINSFLRGEGCGHCNDDREGCRCLFSIVSFIQRQWRIAFTEKVLHTGLGDHRLDAKNRLDRNRAIYHRLSKHRSRWHVSLLHFMTLRSSPVTRSPSEFSYFSYYRPGD